MACTQWKTTSTNKVLNLTHIMIWEEDKFSLLGWLYDIQGERYMYWKRDTISGNGSRSGRNIWLTCDTIQDKMKTVEQFY